MTSSTIDIFFEITKFSKILSKLTLFSKILSKFDKIFENFRKKCQFRKYFRKFCNFEKSVMVDEVNISQPKEHKQSTRSILPVKKGMRTCELTPSTVSFSLPTSEYIANKKRRAQLLVVNVFHGTMHEWNAHATFVSTAKQ